MGFTTDNLVHDATLWVFSRVTRAGRSEVLAPVNIKVRWQDKIDTIKSATGQLIEIHGWIAVDRDILVESIIRKGLVADLPAEPDELYRVVDKSNVDTIDGAETRRTVMATRYSNKLPAIHTP